VVDNPIPEKQDGDNFDDLFKKSISEKLFGYLIKHNSNYLIMS